MIRLAALLGIVFVLGLSAPASADELGGARIEGSLINGTAGGSSVAGVDVVLTIHLGTEEVDSSTSTSDDEGAFVFNGLSVDAGHTLQVTVTF